MQHSRNVFKFEELFKRIKPINTGVFKKDLILHENNCLEL